MKRLCYSVAKGYIGQELEARVSDGALTSVLKGLRNLLAELFTRSQDHTTLFLEKKIKPLTIPKLLLGRDGLPCSAQKAALHCTQ